jgi:arylsulfatase A-like enzyme
MNVQFVRSTMPGKTLTRRAAVAALSSAVAGPFIACRRERRPNLVFILTDDQRWDCLSCAGHPFLHTPNQDRIANEGVHFRNMFVTTSLCSPSRASMLSGLYAHTHGVQNNFTDFPTNLPSYPRQFQAAGYQTAYIGKFHMGEQSDEKRPGFDYWASHKGQGKYYDTEFNVNGNRQVLKGYYTHRVTDLADDWLRQTSRSRPFMMVLGHKAPHGLWTPEPKYAHVFDNQPITRPKTVDNTGAGKPSWVKDRVPTWHGIDGPLYGAGSYENFVRTYLATILSVDDSVGRLYDTLQRMGELDNTVLVYAADNGFLLGEHGAIDKRVMWEESIRVPLLMRYPELLKQPRKIDEMVLNIDLAPSFLDLCGVPALPKTHGRSWKPLLTGTSTGWRKSWFYECNFENEFPYTPNVRGVRTDDWKYMHTPNGDDQPDKYPGELYHVAEDPLETRNLFSDPASQAQLASLRQELVRLQQETDALPDRMPANPKIRFELPEKSIR